MRLPVFNIMYRSGVNSTNNESLLQSDKEERNILQEIKRGKTNWIGHIWCSNCLLTHPVTEGKMGGRIEVTGRRGRRRKQLMDYLKKKRGYWKLKEKALDRTLWRIRGRSYGPVVRQQLMTRDKSRERGQFPCRKYVFYQPL